MLNKIKQVIRKTSDEEMLKKYNQAINKLKNGFGYEEG